MLYSQNAANLIKESEGCAVKLPNGSYHSYPDPASGGVPWTIGWGSTGPDVSKNTVWTLEECNNRLDRTLLNLSNLLTTSLNGKPTTQNQFDAMIDFAYNLGLSNLTSSTLFRKHKSGDFLGASQEFGKWVHASGKVLPGLIKRRATEAHLYNA